MIPKIPQILALITPSCFWGPLKYLQPVGRRKNYTIWSTKFPITDPKWQTQYWIFISASMTSRIEILSWSGKRDTWKGNIDRGYLRCVVVCIQLIRHYCLKKKTGTRLRHRGMSLKLNIIQFEYHSVWALPRSLSEEKILDRVLYLVVMFNGLSREKLYNYL